MRFVSLIAFLSFSTLLLAQEQPSGPESIWDSAVPFITNFSTEDFKAAPQNWCITQGDNGVIYVSNNSGVLEYDGTTWRTIKTITGNPVRSIVKNSEGQIFVGGINEIGYLEADLHEGMKYHSLLDQLDKSNHDFGNVWFTYAIEQHIYFICDNYIFRYTEGTFKAWSKEVYGDFGFAWPIRNNIYVDISGKGLLKLENDSLVMVKGGEQFKGKGVTGMLAYGDKDMILFNLAKEVLLFSNGTLSPLASAAGQKLNAAVYQCLKLSNGDYALATTGGGFYLMDNSGRIKMNVTRELGLVSNVIYSLYEDAEGDIWLATDNGISRIELNSPLRVLNETHDVNENTFDIEYFNRTLFITNSKGIFRLEKAAGGIPRFLKINGIDNLTFYCHVANGNLVISNYDGLFVLDKANNLSLVATEHVVKGESPSFDGQSNLFFDTNSNGIGEINFSNGKWKAGKKRLDIKSNAYGFARSARGDVFINTRRNGVFQVRWNEPGDHHTLSDEYKLIHHDTTRGVSPKVKSIERVGNSLYASIDEQFYKFDEEKQLFEADTAVMNLLKKLKGAWVNEIVSSGGDNYWLTLYHNYQSLIYQSVNGKLQHLEASGRFSNALIAKVFDTKQGIVFFGTNKSIIIHNERKTTDLKNIFKTSIRRILTDRDSVIYSGYGGATQASIPEIDFRDNNLRFHFSLPSYDLTSHNQYQYQLLGFNRDWSGWSNESQVDFTNLQEGNYTFKVRGMNVYGEVSEADEFVFSIAPPWQRTWWALCLYFALLISTIILIVRWRSRGLQREKIELENIIQERTREISQQAMQLKEMDVVKSRFFANISHEFRTPLTLILAPLEHDQQSGSGPDKSSLVLMKRNANRLLELVNQLLDLSKLDAGKMQLHLSQGNIGSFLTIISSSFESLAQAREIEFIRKIDLNAECWYDQDKLEKIVVNLLSNAFRFTPSKGSVQFRATVSQKNNRKFLSISVSDTGKGIPAEEQGKIFMSFYQTKQTLDGNEGGTGLGLSLVKELVKLYGGSIDLKSEVGVGTEFSIELPIDKESFTADQFAEQHVTTEHYGDRMIHEADDLNDEPIEPVLAGKDTILVAEDNEDLREYIKNTLETEYSVVTVKDGEEALSMAAQLVPNLILSDVMMPKVDGMQLAEKVKSDHRTSHIPVILLTARSEHESRIKGLKTGVDDYLTKPFSVEELKVRINNLIQQRRKLAEKFRERILVPVTATVEISLDDKFLNKVRHVIETNMSDPSLTVEKLADEVNLNRTQLLRKVKALTSMSPTDFIKDLRLKKAADLIRQKADTITQIGYAVGFNDQSYFTKCFKKQFGVTPTEYSAQNSTMESHGPT